MSMSMSISNRTGYFEDLVNGGGGGDRHPDHGVRGKKRKEKESKVRRDPQVAANWLTNNLFGLLKDQLGTHTHSGGNGDRGGGEEQDHDLGTGAPQGEEELER